MAELRKAHPSKVGTRVLSGSFIKPFSHCSDIVRNQSRRIAHEARRRLHSGMSNDYADAFMDIAK